MCYIIATYNIPIYNKEKDIFIKSDKVKQEIVYDYNSYCVPSMWDMHIYLIRVYERDFETF